MKYLTKTVTLNTAEIVDESRLNGYGLKADVYAKPDVKLKYTVEICRQTFTVFSQNQKFSVGGSATVLFKDGKCELLYDSIFYNASPFTLNNAIAKLLFFGGAEITDLPDLPYYILKKGLRREKTRRAALENSPKSVAADALVIRRKSYGKWQFGGTSAVRFTLALLIKRENGYFITEFTDWDKTESFGSVLKHAFDLSVGEIIPVLYNPDNPADVTVDYGNLKPFSLEHLPHVSFTENQP